jgi:RHS repeat-associated protein
VGKNNPEKDIPAVLQQISDRKLANNFFCQVLGFRLISYEASQEGHEPFLYDNAGTQPTSHSNWNESKLQQTNPAKKVVWQRLHNKRLLLNAPDEEGTTAQFRTTQAVQLFAPYGSVRYSQGTMPTTHNFTGQRLDSQTGLLYYGFRYYDPVSGRFVRTDTTQTNAGGMDPYAYVGNNPEGRTDPTGHADPYLIYIYEWYMAFHPGDDVYSDGVPGRQLALPNSAVPSGSPSKWPNPTVGTSGPGYPDIANKTRRVIWEVKTGGNMFGDMGTDFPNDRTLYKAAATARWYAARASIIYGTQWSVGDASPWSSDPNLVLYFEMFCGGTRGTCYYRIPGGEVLAIRIAGLARLQPINGVIAYKVVREDEDYPTTPVFVLTPVLAARWWAMMQREQQQEPQLAYQRLPGPSGIRLSLSTYFRIWSLNMF